MIGIFILRWSRFDDGTVGLHPSDFHIGQKIATGSDCRFPAVGKNDGLSIFEQGDFTSFDKELSGSGKVGHRLAINGRALGSAASSAAIFSESKILVCVSDGTELFLFACEYAEYAFVVADKPSGKLFSVSPKKPPSSR